jgi:hypothetical protein
LNLTICQKGANSSNYASSGKVTELEESKISQDNKTAEMERFLRGIHQTVTSHETDIKMDPTAICDSISLAFQKMRIDIGNRKNHISELENGLKSIQQ